MATDERADIGMQYVDTGLGSRYYISKTDLMQQIKQGSDKIFVDPIADDEFTKIQASISINQVYTVGTHIKRLQKYVPAETECIPASEYEDTRESYIEAINTKMQSLINGETPVLDGFRDIDAKRGLFLIEHSEREPCPECNPPGGSEAGSVEDCSTCKGIGEAIEVIDLRISVGIKDDGWTVTDIPSKIVEEVGEVVGRCGPKLGVSYADESNHEIVGHPHPGPTDTISNVALPTGALSDEAIQSDAYACAIELSKPPHPESGNLIESTATMSVDIESISDSATLRKQYRVTETWDVPVAKYTYKTPSKDIDGLIDADSLTTEIYQIGDIGVLGRGGEKSYQRRMLDIASRDNAIRLFGGVSLLLAASWILTAGGGLRGILVGGILLTIGIYSIEKSQTGMYYDGTVSNIAAYIHLTGYTIPTDTSEEDN